MKKFENKVEDLEQKGKVLTALTICLTFIVLSSMVYFGKVYRETGVFTVNGDLEKKVTFICISIIILIGSSLYNSVINTFLYGLIKKLRTEINNRDIKNKETIDELAERSKDLSTSINLFFSTYLRKENNRDKSFEEIKSIASKNNIEVKDNE